MLRLSLPACSMLYERTPWTQGHPMGRNCVLQVGKSSMNMIDDYHDAGDIEAA